MKGMRSAENENNISKLDSVSLHQTAERIRELDKTIPPKPVYEFFKRAFDIVSSSAALVLLSWLFLFTAIAIWQGSDVTCIAVLIIHPLS